MGRERYPLEAARTLRDKELDEAREALARATRALEQADRSVLRAEDRVRAHRHETAEVHRRESERDGAGRSAGEMLAARDYLTRRRDDEGRLVERVAAAREEAARARQALERARATLAEAQAAREAVERHHGRWKADRARVAERRQEAEQDDLAAARHHREK